jgi:hypothetical protein
MKGLDGSNPPLSTIQSIAFCTFWRIASGKDFRQVRGSPASGETRPVA